MDEQGATDVASAVGEAKGRLLLVDDEPVASGMLGMMLKKHGYEVRAVASGDECLRVIEEFTPEVVLLDIEMGPGMDGYETCEKIRRQFDRANLTIIFVSGHDTLEERLRAYDVGGDDFVAKPFDVEEIRRKIVIAVGARLRRRKLAAENASLEETADVAMRGYSEMGAVLQFARGALKCRTLYSLGELVIKSMRNTKSECNVQLRGSAAAGTLTLTPVGLATPLEESVLEGMSSYAHVFQFKSRMIVNYDTVSLLVVNMPADDQAQAGRIRDYAAIIAETAQDAVANISLRFDAVDRATELRALAEAGRSSTERLAASQLAQRADTHAQLEAMVEKIEGMYYRLGLSDRQEAAVSDAVRSGRDEVLALFARYAAEFDSELAVLLDGQKRASAYEIDMEEESSVVDELWD